QSAGRSEGRQWRRPRACVAVRDVAARRLAARGYAIGNAAEGGAPPRERTDGAAGDSRRIAPERVAAHESAPAPAATPEPAPSRTEPAPTPQPAARQPGVYKSEAEIFKQMPWIRP